MDSDIDQVDINLLLYTETYRNVTSLMTAVVKLTHSNRFSYIFKNFDVTIYPEKIELKYNPVDLSFAANDS